MIRPKLSIPQKKFLCERGESNCELSYLQYPGDLPNKLQMINLKALSVEACQSLFNGINPVFESQICSLTKSGEGACHVSPYNCAKV